MKKIIVPLMVLLVMVVAFYAGQWLQNVSQAPQVLTVERIQAGSCDPSIKPCKIKVGQQKAELFFQQAPSPLKPFKAVVETDIKGLEQVGLRFYMQGMDMGYNTFELEQASQGRWQKDVILPVCSSGSKNWRVELQLLFKDRLLISDLGFKQI